MTEYTEKTDEEVPLKSVKPSNPFGILVVIYWTFVILWGIQSEMRCSGYGCYEGLLLLPLGAFGMLMTIPYLLMRMSKK
tara:strand:- start:1250 stop:1486 length:237 start_codon:yes stop_codon:yes gene_type:complete